MAVDNFFKRPYRGSKSGGTKCTKCEVVNGCSDGGKCVYSLICVTVSIQDCASEPSGVDFRTAAVAYDCDEKRFDLSVICGAYEVDLFLTYEQRYGEDHAVLRSEILSLEEWIPFSDGADARCPSFDFSVATIRPYATVSLGPQMCIDSGPEDCTAGRCLPKFLCGEVYTASSPDEPLLTTLEWYVNDTVEIASSCCCNANIFPEMLIARVINYSDGCTCIGPKRVSGPYHSAENSGAELSDAGATFHLRHRIASVYDDFLHLVPEGANVWVSEGPSDDIVSLCPGVGQIINEDTRSIRGRMLFWCDPESGQFKSYFEMIGDYESVHEIDDVKILRCNPFYAKARGIFESTNCQDLSSVDGTGVLEIAISEFQGWVGPNPEPGREGKQITLYTERTNTAAPPQTLAGDCWPKMHLQQDEQVTFKSRDDVFWIDSQWPEGVWDESEYLLFENSPYSQIQKIVVRPKPCTGCEVVIDDPYGEVQTDCCGNPIPRTLYVSAVNENDCPCAEGTQLVLIYDDEQSSWVGEANFGSGECGCTVRMRLTCRTLVGSGAWDLFIYFNDSLVAFWTQGDPLDRAFQCDPFLWITRPMSNNECCDPVYAASDFYWIITE